MWRPREEANYIDVWSWLAAAKPGQGKARTRQDKTRQDKPSQRQDKCLDKTRHHTTRRHKNKTRQDTTRQDTTKKDNSNTQGNDAMTKHNKPQGRARQDNANITQHTPCNIPYHNTTHNEPRLDRNMTRLRDNATQYITTRSKGNVRQGKTIQDNTQDKMTKDNRKTITKKTRQSQDKTRQDRASQDKTTTRQHSST